MAHLYASGNYLVGNDGSLDYQFIATECKYSEDTDTITVFDQFGTMVIQKADIGTLEDSDTGASFYTLSSLLRFLRTNTGSGLEVVDDLLHLFWSAGAITGFALTDNMDGTINLALGTAYLRTSAVESSPLAYFEVAATVSLPMTGDALNYVYLDYNSGSPVVAASTNVADFNCLNKCILHLVQTAGTDLYYQSVIAQNVDSNRKLRRRFFETELMHRAQGLILSSTLLKPNVSAGIIYFALTKKDVAAFDTNVADTFTYVYDNAGLWTRVTAQTSIDNLKYSGGAGLVTMTNNKWKCDWLYLIPDSPDTYFIVYGDTQYNSYADASMADPPSSLPPELLGMGLLLGRYVVKKSSTTPYSESAFKTTFNSSALPLLSDLSDTDISSTVKTGASLVWNGTDWVDYPYSIWTINLMTDVVSEDIYAGYDCSIDSVVNIVNAPAISITLNGVAYTLGNPIVTGDKIVVTATVAGVVNLYLTLA